MRAEKQYLTREYLERLQASPYFIVVNYTGLKVGPLTELRRRLAPAGAELHVVKNSLFRLAAKEAGLEDIGDLLAGQLAVITGRQDAAAAAKVVKTFQAEFERPKFRFGYLGNQRLSESDLMALADLPPLPELRARLLAGIQAPATQLVRLLQTPATQLVRVIRAYAEKTS